jgi:hypothetical protein
MITLIPEQRADRKSTKICTTINLSLVSWGKSPAYELLLPKIAKVASVMSERIDTASELVEISRLNGSFKRNYGTSIGACLYLRSIRAVRGGSFFWTSSVSLTCSAALAWLMKHGSTLLHI